VTLLEAAAALRRSEVSSVELTAAALRRIERLNPSTNAMQTVMAEAARERAKQADEELGRGEGRGPLHGIPIAVKDLFCTKGVRTTGGSKLFEEHVPDHDATVVEWLRAGGAVLIGKTGMHELAYGITSSNPHFGAVRNPRDLDRTADRVQPAEHGQPRGLRAGQVLVGAPVQRDGADRVPQFLVLHGEPGVGEQVDVAAVVPVQVSEDHVTDVGRVDPGAV